MSIHVQAMYVNGVIQPDRPLDLPNNTAVEVQVTLVGEEADTRRRPPAPRFSPQELRDRIARYAISAPSLPIDFARADIYQDHD